MILLGQAMYMRSPDLGTGDKWLKIDLSDPNSLFGMIGKATDPEVMFKAMESPALGHETFLQIRVSP